ncbi:dTDP-4-amino-4,6-dideoxygalactose transaminase [Jatrophihabitans endophyticus]|uniref:dTDP-4-amino-4,6-dideoxygalactose transaminase n=1 Tax=Jatrophihabitans endophyticus TaxID=1206085 RepID=A0A1M5INZ5_9ACTN|nr:DegT/DnrJ/EryC1/StrS family aminotransferase [Jatrophihabitans endophyticus]SHG29503.1 dTDP-4-amino-4,6-dideoxygalactose transaminase [Jatrophihabitans endophyticus]
MTAVLLSAPDVGELESRYVAAALASGWVAPAGPDLAAFETEMATRVGVGHAVGLSSGTAGLHLGLLTLGVGRGDVVLTSTMTFAATANAIAYTGASPFFVDSDATGNVDVGLLAEAARTVVDSGRRLGAIVPVDLLGKCCDLAAIERLAAELEVPLLVDAAESVGATRDGRPSGSFGAASVFSFNGNKIMTTSGGGMLLTDDGALAERVRYLSTQARQPVAHYEHTDIGYNYRLSNVLAALGRAQLARLDRMIERRRAVRAAYRAQFDGVVGVEVFGGDDAADNCWLTCIVVDPTAGWSPTQLSQHLAARGIESRPMWKPMHLQPVFANTERLVDGTAERLFARGLTLPSGSGMTDPDLARVRAAIDDFLAAR